MPRFHVQRSIEIGAAPDTVYDRVADFKTWTSWSPWLCCEPEAEVVVSDDSTSVGSTYAWKGEIVGQGEIEHLALERGRSIKDEIRFLKPFKSRSDVAFDLEPAGGGTRITWHMNGSLPWFLFWMKPQMETFIGMDYDRGLKMLKEWIETDKIDSKTNIRGIESVGPIRMVGVRKTCAIEDVGKSMGEAFAEADKELPKRDLPTDGVMISVYHKFDPKAGTFDYTGGYVMPDSVGSLPSDMSTWSLPECQALCVEHVGDYAHLGNAWSAANQHARYNKLKQCKLGAFERYKNSPDDTPSAELVTEIYLPLK